MTQEAESLTVSLTTSWELFHCRCTPTLLIMYHLDKWRVFVRILRKLFFFFSFLFFVKPELFSSIYSMRVYYEATLRGSPSGKYCYCLSFKRQMTMWKPISKGYIMPCQCQHYESRAWEIAYLAKYELSRIRTWFGIPTST